MNREIHGESLQKLEELASEICERESCRLYDLELAGDARGRVLRVWIDKTTSVSIDDCANVSNGLSLRLDVEDLIPGGAYHLEVSSPGMDRKLTKPWHYQGVVGQRVRVRLQAPLVQCLKLVEESKAEASPEQEELPESWSKRRQVEECLERVEELGPVFELDQRKVLIPFEAIEKAQVIVEFDGPAGKEPGARKKGSPGKKGGQKKNQRAKSQKKR